MAVDTKDTARKKAASFSRGKKMLIGVNVGVMIVIALAIFMGVCHLASLPVFRNRIDLTQDEAFTLSPLTRDLLYSLDKEVEVYALYHRPYGLDFYGLEKVERDVIAYAGKLLEEYVINSRGKIKVTVLDRDRDNLEVQALNERIGLGKGNGVVFLCGSNRKDLAPAELARIDSGGVDPSTNVIQPAQILAYNTEAGLTGALLSVMEEIKPKAYFTTGRSESGLEDLAPEGLSDAAEILRRSNFEVESLKLYAEPVVPDDCAALVVAGPRDDFTPEEVAAVRTYLMRQGRLFLALSPESTSSLEGILADFDLGLDRAITCQETAGLIVAEEEGFKKSWITTDGFSRESPITRALVDRGGFGRFFKAGAVNRPSEGLHIEELVYTHEDCWGDVHPPGQEGNYFFDSASEIRGSRVIGVTATGLGEFEGAKLVFFAETHFYTNGLLLRGGRANMPLFTNALNWLAAREYLLDIPPKTPYESRVDLTESEYNEIGLFVVVIIPAAAAVLGAVVWWLRRR